MLVTDVILTGTAHAQFYIHMFPPRLRNKVSENEVNDFRNLWSYHGTSARIPSAKEPSKHHKYDPVIIERTIGLVLGPFPTLYRSFLKRCALTNNADRTIWQALSKHPKMRQSPDPRPLWLVVETPSGFGPELAYRQRISQPSLMDVTRYFWYTIISIYMYVYHILMTSPLWLTVGPQSL